MFVAFVFFHAHGVAPDLQIKEKINICETYVNTYVILCLCLYVSYGQGCPGNTRRYFTVFPALSNIPPGNTGKFFIFINLGTVEYMLHVCYSFHI